MVKYSFIIPVYNCEKYLHACIESILNQNGDDTYEVILVDDGTKDKSGKIADELAEQYENVYTYHKENGGAASARNVGINKSNGEYLLFIDGDDTVDKNLLQSIDQALFGHDQAMLVYGMNFDYYRAGQIVRNEVLSCKHQGIYSISEVLEQYQSFFYDNVLSSACNKVFNASIVKKNHLRFQEAMTLYEDYEFVLRYLMYVSSVICLNQPFYHYRHDLEHVHINHRVKNFDSLRKNLIQLLDTSVVLAEKIQRVKSQLLHVSANLYMQLLTQHLMVNYYTLKELKIKLKAYCNEKSFEKVLSLGGRLSGWEELLYSQVQTEKFVKIYLTFTKKKMISAIKRVMKRILRGLKIRK